MPRHKRSGLTPDGTVIFVPAAAGAERMAVLHGAGVLAVIGSWSVRDKLLPTLRGRADTTGLVGAGETR